jgi:hypothetical protein
MAQLRHDPNMTRILGIVGGTGPESTIDYYRSVIATWQATVDWLLGTTKGRRR